LATTVAKGAASEAAARAYLGARGFRIIAANQRFEGGELDLVAEDGDVIVFIEVRSRADDALGAPVETVDARKRRRVVAAARAWIDANADRAAAARAMRFDVVGITWDADPPRIEHIPDAFDAAGNPY